MRCNSCCKKSSTTCIHSRLNYSQQFSAAHVHIHLCMYSSNRRNLLFFFVMAIREIKISSHCFFAAVFYLLLKCPCWILVFFVYLFLPFRNACRSLFLSTTHSHLSAQSGEDNKSWRSLPRKLNSINCLCSWKGIKFLRRSRMLWNCFSLLFYRSNQGSIWWHC